MLGGVPPGRRPRAYQGRAGRGASCTDPSGGRRCGGGASSAAARARARTRRQARLHDAWDCSDDAAPVKGGRPHVTNSFIGTQEPLEWNARGLPVQIRGQECGGRGGGRVPPATQMLPRSGHCINPAAARWLMNEYDGWTILRELPGGGQAKVFVVRSPDAEQARTTKTFACPPP